LLEVRDAAEVGAVAKRISRALRKPVPHGRAILNIGASIGIASTRPVNGAIGVADVLLRAADLVKAADEAMYSAKSTGGDRIVFAGSSGQSTDANTLVRFPAVA